MLTRLQFGKRDFRCFIRYFSDKSSDNIPKTPETKADDVEKNNDTEINTDKLQQILKQMLEEPKISDKEYRERFATAPERQIKKKQENETNVKMDKIDEKLTKAAGDVAQTLGGDVKQTEAELLSKVLGKINKTSTTLSDLLIGMKVDRSKEPEYSNQKTRGQQVKQFTEKARSNQQNVRYVQRKESTDGARFKKSYSAPQVTTVNIFGGEPLGIFKPKEANYGTKLDMWDALNQREVTLATTQPPANYFQKMILWTEQGKVWKFPIDNEQGLEEEKNVHFSEHVFLDAHLEDWCPKKGPIRHFMELVCVGLSKNAFYTVKEKRDHIQWYREYFESKKDLLTEVGAWEVKSSNSEESASM